MVPQELSCSTNQCRRAASRWSLGVGGIDLHELQIAGQVGGQGQRAEGLAGGDVSRDLDLNGIIRSGQRSFRGAPLETMLVVTRTAVGVTPAD